jgi:hypothetical protein
MSRRVATAVVFVAMLAACSSASPQAARPSAPSTTRAVNAAYDSGDTVTITAKGFVPRELIALVNVPIHFVNHTSSTQRVQFEHSRDASGALRRSDAIPPGGEWSYTPTSWESATYHAVDRPTVRGQIQLQPPANP